MAPEESHDITRLLEDARHGREHAVDDLLGLVYTELHSIAGQRMRNERPGNVLQTTGLVNEAYLRLFGRGTPQVADREQFFRAASCAMKRILIDLSRADNAKKRGGNQRAVQIEEWMSPESPPFEKQLEVQSGIDALSTLDPRAARIVELALYAGRNNDEIAVILGVTRRTVERDLASARLFLKRHLSSDAAHA